MRGIKNIRKAGFTLMELMVASAITVIVLGSFMAVFIHAMKLWQQEEIKNELNINLEEAMEKIRIDLRLSSVGVGLMSFYAPTNDGDYTAISLPLSTDSDGDGLLDRGTNDMMLWNQTVVYHVRPGTPDQLLRTVFSPRYTNATASDFYSQLTTIVAATSDAQVAAAHLTGETCTSRVIFENLVTLKFRSPEATYDCYNPTEQKAETYNWGSLVASSGTHQIKFTVTNKNSASSGYKILVDAVRFSTSGSVRDGELFTPTNSHPIGPYYSCSNNGGGTISGAYKGPEWIGQSALILSGTSTGSITFNIYNDLWCDNNFNSPSYLSASNCSVIVSTNFTPADVVVSPEKGITWSAIDCGDQVAPSSVVAVTAVTNALYGSTNEPLQVLKRDGCWARFTFERETNTTSHSLLITNAMIMMMDNEVLVSNITFNGGASYVMMYPEGPQATNSDWVPMWEISKSSNYLVRFETSESVGDLDVDMFIGNLAAGSVISKYRNDGTPSNPSFVSEGTWINPGAGGRPVPYLADLNGDGAYDLIIAGGTGGLRWYRNDGNSRGANMQYAGLLSGICGCQDAGAAFADIDGDGDLDCAFTHYHANYITYLKNNGTARSPNFVSFGNIASGLASTYLFPEFADINGDGLYEMFAGNGTDGNIYYWQNSGTKTSPSFSLVTVAYLSVPHSSIRGMPRFIDIDKDGDLDLFLGAGQGGVAPDGELWFYQNTGTVFNAAWAPPATNLTFVNGYAFPAFANIDGSVGAWGNGPAFWQNTNGVTLSSTNGVTNSCTIGLSSVEVGYPRFAKFKSGIFDTCKAAPVYHELNWTESVNAGCDVYIRARFSNLSGMEDVTDADWVGESGGTNYYQNNTGNAIPSGTSYRYVQYEALLECGKNGNTWAHTNDSPPLLRDVTIDWPAATGLADLQVDLGKGPDCGIVTVTVDGQTLVKGVEAEMQIYKEGRTGTNYASGIMEVKPLNTGK